MRSSTLSRSVALSLGLFLAGALVRAAEPLPAVTAALRLIGVGTIPHRLEFQGTIVGGLSGLDYDAAHDRWIAESDDKSEFSPARVYTVQLDYDERTIRAVNVVGVASLRQPDGTLYPDRPHALAGAGEIPDFESVRFDPRDGSLWYASEGDRGLGMNPFVRHAAPDGRFLDELPLPEMFRVHPNEPVGPRHNLSFEGLTFAPDGETLWVAMEGPRFEDGPIPTTTAGAGSRLTHYDRAGRMLGQFVYPLDPIPVAPAAGKSADNGLSELLAVTENRFLALEREGCEDAAGRYRFHIRLYEVNTAEATDVKVWPSLVGREFRPVTKRLVLNFDQLGLPWIDNLEGLAWGRRLPNGHATLVAVADDNFAPNQQTQFFVFEVGAASPSNGPRTWDGVFDGVVQDERRISGFVGEYRWLSNFLPCAVEWDGRKYGSSEAAYQSAKFPPAEREEFTRLDPDAAKKKAHAKPLADAAAWEVRKDQAMREIVWAKFSQHPELAARLLATGDRLLEETNWWGDKYWGVFQGEGENRLGKLLMETRSRLRAAGTETGAGKLPARP